MCSISVLNLDKSCVNLIPERKKNMGMFQAFMQMTNHTEAQCQNSMGRLKKINPPLNGESGTDLKIILHHSFFSKLLA